jgi:hypothetical protein
MAVMAVDTMLTREDLEALSTEQPSLTILDRVDGRYVETARAAGDRTISLTSPFSVTMNPAALVVGTM